MPGLVDKLKGMMNPNEKFRKKIEANADKILTTVAHAYQREVKFLPKSMMPELDNALHTRNILEYSVWYSGKQEQLKRFYRQAINHIEGGELFREFTSFWKDNREDEDYIFLHSGFPQSITQTMVDIETLAGMEYTINGIEDKEDEIYERLNEILKNSKFNTEIWQEGTAQKSVFGGVCYRPIINTNIAPTPIVQVVQPEQFRLKVENGFVTGFTFVEIIETEDAHNKDIKTYIEVLEHNEYIDGNVAISYEVFRYDPGKIEPTEMTLKEYFGADASKYSPIVIPGFKCALPVYIKNKSANSEFRGSTYGESDYSNNIDLFHSLDQVESSLVNQIADSQMKTLVNENLIDKTFGGTWTNWNKWKRSYTITKGDLDELGNANMIDHSQGRVDFESHLQSSEYIIQNILSNVGLAPETLGIQGASPDASGLAIRERENITSRTREKKLALQKVGLERLFINLLMLDDYMNGQSVGEYTINIVFNAFTQHTMEERMNLMNAASTTGILGDQTILEMFFPEKTPDEIGIMMRIAEESRMKRAAEEAENRVDAGVEEDSGKDIPQSHAELKLMAKEKGVEEYWLMTKQDLVTALNL